MKKSILLHTSLLGKIVRFPLKLIPRKTKIRILSGKNKGLKWITGSGLYRYWMGFFEEEKQIIMSQHIKKKHVYFDIGAHVGFFTILGARLVGEEGQVFAWEPVQRNFEFLNKHIKLNNFKNVTIFKDAIWDSEGEVSFSINLDDQSMGNISKDGNFKVKTVSLDFLFENRIIPLPDSIKIDVEGSELFVLKGGKKLIEQAKPIIFLSTHGFEIHKECIEMLQNWGYTVSSMESNYSLYETDELLAVYKE